MKIIKKYIIPVILILFLTILSSCRDISVDEDIIKNDIVYDIRRNSELKRYYGDFEPEENYIPTNTIDLDGILSPVYMFNNNRFYFPVNKRYEIEVDGGTSGGGMTMLTYIDLHSGKQRFICPDPLCKHMPDECKYIDLQTAFFAEKNIFYTTFIDGGFYENWTDRRFVIAKVDLNNDRIDIVYRTEEDPSRQAVNVEGIYNNKLYFFVDTRTENEGQREVTSTRTLKIMDLSTHNLSEAVNFPEQYVNIWSSIMFIDENTFYFQSLRNIFTTDFNFENEKIIYSFENNERLGNYFYDTSTKELFFLARNTKDNTGIIYVYGNSAIKKLNMPHTDIYSFMLTNGEIYYSPYESIFLGISPRDDLPMKDREVYNYTKGKIYVTDRHSREEAELIFDDGANFNYVIGGSEVCEYIIIGDYMYFPYMEFLDDGTHVWFRSAHFLEQVRINLKENTILYFAFE